MLAPYPRHELLLRGEAKAEFEIFIIGAQPGIETPLK
jgi:hypothetical protein